MLTAGGDECCKYICKIGFASGIGVEGTSAFSIPRFFDSFFDSRIFHGVKSRIMVGGRSAVFRFAHFSTHSPSKIISYREL